MQRSLTPLTSTPRNNISPPYPFLAPYSTSTPNEDKSVAHPSYSHHNTLSPNCSQSPILRPPLNLHHSTPQNDTPFDISLNDSVAPRCCFYNSTLQK